VCDTAFCLHQRIAGIDYLVSVPPGVSAPPPGALQAKFAAHLPSAGDVIHVDLVAGEIPDPSTWRILLSSGQAWSIRQNGAQRCLCLGEPTAFPLMGLVACWMGDGSHATVHCGPGYLVATPDGVEMRYSAGYPVDQMLFIYYLAPRRGLLVHAAGLVADGRALILPGVSGAGKSTLAQQFLARRGSSLLSDDRIIVREMEGRYVAFGTPWPGDAAVAVNASAPLAAILFPARGTETHISELKPQEALDRLLPATSILWHEQELLSSQLDTCERLLRDVPAFELSWSLSAGVVDAVHEFVRHL
jgi:hypothetical protein